MRRAGSFAAALWSAVIVVAAMPASHAAAAPVRHGSTRATGTAKAFAAATRPAPAAAAERRHENAALAPATVGENPPGRVSQQAGFAGYTFGYQQTISLVETVTLPSVTEQHVTNPPPPWQSNMGGSQGVVGLYNDVAGVQIFLDYNNAGGTWQGMRVLSTLDAGCSPINGTCPAYQPGLMPGDQVELTLSTTSSGSSAGVVDLTNPAASKSWTSGRVVSATGAVVQAGLEDFCYAGQNESGINEPCIESVPSMPPGPPPGYSTYGSVPFSLTANGGAIGALFSGSTLAYWAEALSVWTATADDQPTFVGLCTTCETFAITYVDILLPAVTISAVTPPELDRPATGTATISFTVTLAFTPPANQPVYVDYATKDGTAVAGTDYQAASGTITFAKNTSTLSQTVPVTVIGGAESGGDHVFSLVLSNPSYAVTNASASATIHEGPVIYSVSPTAIPLTGDGVGVTIIGADFGAPGAADTLQLCDASGYGAVDCMPATANVVGDTEITYTAPDATQIQPQNHSLFFVDNVVTDVAGTSSPITTADQVEYGCNTKSIDDGGYVVHGCLTDQTQQQDELTEAQSQVDGLIYSASPTDTMTYALTGGDVASSSTPGTTVSLNIAGQLIKIFKGQVTQQLSQPLTFTIPGGVAIAGMKLSGQLVITPITPGVATGSVTVTLPNAISAAPGAGGDTAPATGTLTFTTTASGGGGPGGISNLKITVPSANFLNLYSLSNVVLSFQAPGTWNVSGTASSGGGATSTFAGALTYAGGKLTSAALSIGALPLAGLLDLSNLSVTYSSGSGWTGGGTVTQATSTGTESATVKLAFNTSGVMTSGSITTGPVTLFGVLNLKSFALTYKSGAWSLAVVSTLSGGSGASVSITESGGVVTTASVSVTKVQFLGKFTVDSASLAYSATTPFTNPACDTGSNGGTISSGAQVWCGALSVSLPDAGVAASGYGIFVGGAFSAGGVSVSGFTVPLIDGVTLTSLGAQILFPPVNPAEVITGSAGFTFGPKISGASLFTASASLTRTFPGSGTVGSYAFSIDQVTALQGTGAALVLGSGSVTVPDTGATTFTVTLGSGSPAVLSLGSGVTLSGSLTGSFTASGLNLKGTATVTIPGLSPHSVGVISDAKGIAACYLYNGGKVGFQYTWSGSLTYENTSGCTTLGF